MPCKSFMIADLLNEETLTKPPQYSLPSRPVRVRGNDNEFENVKQISSLWHWLRPNDEDIYLPSSELELVNLSVMSLASIVGSKVVMEIPIPAYVRGDSNSTLLNCTPKRRNRTVFTDLQLQGLEKMFEKQRYLTSEARLQLATSLGLTQLQVKTWYQNRRMKWKKEHQQGKQSRPSHLKSTS